MHTPTTPTGFFKNVCSTTGADTGFHAKENSHDSRHEHRCDDLDVGHDSDAAIHKGGYDIVKRKISILMKTCITKPFVGGRIIESQFVACHQSALTSSCK